MKMNGLEHLLMNNPVRSAIQRHYAAPLLKKLARTAVPGPQDTALEIGCGNGVGLKIIRDSFDYAQVWGSDLDPVMIKKAQRRCASDSNIHVEVGTADGLADEDCRYDAVFGFGVIHHVPQWTDAIREVQRVLRPGGLFYSEESFAPFLEHALWRRVLEHPPERFSAQDYLQALEDAGLKVLGHQLSRGEGLGWLVAQKEQAAA